MGSSLVQKTWNSGFSFISSKKINIIGRDAEEKVKYVLGLGYFKLEGNNVKTAEAVFNISIRHLPKNDQYIRIGSLLYSEAEPGSLVEMQSKVNKALSVNFNSKVKEQAQKELREAKKILTKIENIQKSSSAFFFSSEKALSSLFNNKNSFYGGNIARDKSTERIGFEAKRSLEQSSLRRNIIRSKVKRSARKRKFKGIYDNLAKQIRYMLLNPEKIVGLDDLPQIEAIANALNIDLNKQSFRKGELVEEIVYNIIQYVMSLKDELSAKNAGLIFLRPKPEGIEIIKKLLLRTSFWLIVSDDVPLDQLTQAEAARKAFMVKFNHWDRQKGSENQKYSAAEKEEKKLKSAFSTPRLVRRALSVKKTKQNVIEKFLDEVLNLTPTQISDLFKNGLLDESKVSMAVSAGEIEYLQLQGYARQNGLEEQLIQFNGNIPAIIRFLAQHYTKTLKQHEKLTVKANKNLAKGLTLTSDEVRALNRQQDFINNSSEIRNIKRNATNGPAPSSSLPFVLNNEQWQKALKTFQPVYVIGGNIYAHRPSTDAFGSTSSINQTIEAMIDVLFGSEQEVEKEVIKSGKKETVKEKKRSGGLLNFLHLPTKEEVDERVKKSRAIHSMIDPRFIKGGISSLATNKITPVMLVNKGINTSDINTSMLLDLIPLIVNFIPFVGQAASAAAEVALGILSESSMSNLKFATGGSIRANKNKIMPTSFVSGDSLNSKPNPEIINVDWNNHTIDVKPINQTNNNITNNVQSTSRMTTIERQRPMAVDIMTSTIVYNKQLSGTTNDNRALKVYPVVNPFEEKITVGNTKLSPMEVLLLIQDTLTGIFNAVQTGNNIQQVISNANTVMVKEIGRLTNGNGASHNYYGDLLDNILKGR